MVAPTQWSKEVCSRSQTDTSEPPYPPPPRPGCRVLLTCNMRTHLWGWRQRSPIRFTLCRRAIQCCGKPRKLLVLCCVIGSPGYARKASQSCCSKKEKPGSGQQQPLPQGTGLRQIALWRETRSPHHREEGELPLHSVAPGAAAGLHPTLHPFQPEQQLRRSLGNLCVVGIWGRDANQAPK